MLSFPDDVLRVRLYRHEGQAPDGVWQLDSAYAPGKGSLIASVGMDGRASLLLLDEMDLMPHRRREQVSRLYTVLALGGESGSGSGSDAGAGMPMPEGEEAGDGVGCRLTCDMDCHGAALAQEQFDVSPKGDITVPLRASLTAVRVLPVESAGGEKTKAVVTVGSFSGLCRVLALR